MRHLLRNLATLCSLICLLMLDGSHATGLPTHSSYDVTALKLPGASAKAMGLNDAGQIVGVLALRGQQAFLYSHGRVRQLESLAGAHGGAAAAVNDTGQVAGTAPAFPDRTHSFLWQDGRATDLGSLGGGLTVAHGINARGDVVGASLTAKSELHAFRSARGVLRDLGTLPQGNESVAWAVNDRGQVVGEGGIQPGRLEFGDSHAFLWQQNASGSSRMADLGSLPGCAHSRAMAINGLGQAVGSAGQGELIGKYASGVRAVLWSRGGITDLGTLSGRDSYARHINITEARSINDKGQVVGDALVGRGVYHAFLRQNGHLSDLNTLISKGGGYELDAAVGINNKGQIVCNGLRRGQRRGSESTVFLLTPYSRAAVSLASGG